MGVDPTVQRQGLGGRLLEPVLGIADRDRVDCYLETADPRNSCPARREAIAALSPAIPPPTTTTITRIRAMI
jgi:hypothetical protein